MNADVVIIGGGIQGCATAYHLARAGASVIVLEKDYVSRQASGVNAGGVRVLGRHLAEIELSLAAMRLWENLDEELQAETGYRRSTMISIALDEADVAALERRHAALAERGHRHETLIDADELFDRVPAASRACLGGMLSEDDGYANPYQSTLAFRNAAIRNGAEFREGEAAQAIRRFGQTWQVSTAKATYEAEKLVNCAGAWSNEISQMIGDTFLVSYSAPMLMVTQRMPIFVEPVIGAVSRPMSFKQFENGTVLMGGGSRGIAMRDQNRTRLDCTRLSRAARTVMEVFPIMRQAVVNRMWAGLEAFTPDDIPVIGPSVAAEGAYHAFGFCGHGFQLGPIVGQVMADMVLGRQNGFDLSDFAIDRLDKKGL